MSKAANLKASKYEFFTKQGGMSQNEFSSLNCSYSSGDNMNLVSQNLEIVRKKMQADVLFTLKQVHGNGFIVVDESHISQNAQTIEADALITKLPNVCLGILTADCAPLLILGQNIVAAVHCGWRSAKADIIANVVDKVNEISENATLKAIIGPCAHVESYTVQKDFISNFEDKSRFFANYIDGIHFDLVGYIADKLYKSGISNVNIINDDTVTNTSRFFSYRWAQKYTNGKCGRQISCVMLQK